MPAPAASPRSPVASAGWVVAVLVAGLLVLILLPTTREEPAPPAPVLREPTELEKLGLPNNVDLEGLPVYFAHWADQGKWKDNRVWFAYQNPVSGEFEYIFEANRTVDGYRFRESWPNFDWDYGPEIAEGCPILFLEPAQYPMFADPGPPLKLGPSREREVPGAVPVQFEGGSAAASPPEPIHPPIPRR